MTKTPKAMTRKEALAVLMQVQNQWLCNLSSENHQQAESSSFLDKVYEAMRVLTVTVHGTPKSHQYGLLCEVCLLRYTEHFVQEQEKTIETWCCTPCRDRLHNEGKLIEKPSTSDEVNT